VISGDPAAAYHPGAGVRARAAELRGMYFVYFPPPGYFGARVLRYFGTLPRTSPERMLRVGRLKCTG
jgi:hypothetical protein